jgi:hypothetical protein
VPLRFYTCVLAHYPIYLGWLPASASVTTRLSGPTCMKEMRGCINLRRVTCPQEGPPGPTAPRDRLPAGPARYPPAGTRWPAGPATRSTSLRARAWKGASGAEPGTRLAPSRERPSCSTPLGGPSVTSETFTGPPDQPVNGRLACAGGESAAPRTISRAPQTVAGRLSVCGRSRARPAATGGLFGPGAE